MKILIGCEESQAVTKAFRTLSHEAYSCDILPCSGGHPEWHIQSDVLAVIKGGFFNTQNGDLQEVWNWDMGIFFPPCTHLSAAGAPSWKIKQADGRQQEAIDFVIKIWDCGIPKIVIENPTGILSTKWMKPNQIINPFMFGDPYRKRTCLWVKGLPILNTTDIVEPTHHLTSNSYRGGKRKDGTRPISKLPVLNPWDNSKQRSKTMPGIARAMADQWSKI